MGFEVWIAILLVASALSGGIGYFWAKKRAPSQARLDALAAELDEARSQSESVQSDVNEHFEQSAMLFGKLASDYREFLEHFSNSAQTLGLSEGRARELIEQGFQPLLTHEEARESARDESEETSVAEVTVEMPEQASDDSNPAPVSEGPVDTADRRDNVDATVDLATAESADDAERQRASS